MGFDSNWWLVTPAKREGRVPLSEWLETFCQDAAALTLPDDNDIGFFMGLCNWRATSPLWQRVRDSGADALRETGLYERPGPLSPTVRKGISEDHVAAAARRPAQNLKHLRNVLPSLGVSASVTKADGESIYVSGIEKRAGLSLLARLATWELERDPALGAATFDRYVERPIVEEFLRLLGTDGEVPGTCFVFVTHT